jgi:ABC-type Mn2+/Zn2+ transport system ATPase subunit
MSVSVSELAVGYGAEPVLTGVEFSAGPGTSISVLGPNGGGKTTLFKALLGELSPSSGRVELTGRPAYVAQTDRTRLDLPVSALDVALMGMLARGGWWRPPRRAEREAAQHALERVGLAAEAGLPFGGLSGGQRQRVVIARALVQDAPVLLLDEPLAGVDPVSAERIEALMAALRDEGRTLLVSTHDVKSARGFDRVLCLNRRQVAFGPPSVALVPRALEETYGSEIVVLGEGVRAIAVGHHGH